MCLFQSALQLRYPLYTQTAYIALLCLCCSSVRYDFQFTVLYLWVEGERINIISIEYISRNENVFQSVRGIMKGLCCELCFVFGNIKLIPNINRVVNNSSIRICYEKFLNYGVGLMGVCDFSRILTTWKIGWSVRPSFDTSPQCLKWKTLSFPPLNRRLFRNGDCVAWPWLALNDLHNGRSK